MTVRPFSSRIGRVFSSVVQICPVNPGVQDSTSTVSKTGCVRWKLCHRTPMSGAAMKTSMRASDGPTKAANVLNFIGPSP